MKTGGKSPIGGPTYYSDLYPVQYDTTNAAAWIDAYLKAGNALTFPDRSFPSSYDGKLFIAEWMRDWVNTVSFDADGALSTIEPFMPDETFSHPIELEFGPDGALYMLEYGPFWFAQHPEARLVRIDYVRGNRPPIAHIEASQAVGAAPLTIQVSANSSYDLDEANTLTYRWYVGESAISTEPQTTYTFEQPGVYTLTLSVTDDELATTTEDLPIAVGNSMPTISLEVTNNQSFFWPGQPVEYEAHIEDMEDGSLASGGISPEDVVVTIGATDMSPDVTMLAQDHAAAVNTYIPRGLKLINDSGCKACHAIEQASVGPSYKEIADAYTGGEPERIEMLVGKVIEGGSGTWGDRVMSAHPQLSRAEVTEMVQYILSLSSPATGKHMPTAGTIEPESMDEIRFTITYRDKGGDIIESLTARSEFVLRPARMAAVESDGYHMASKIQQ